MIDYVDVKPSVQTAMALVLLACLWVISRGLMRKSGDRTSPFSFDELLCDFGPDGKMHPSILRCAYAGAFVFSVWVMTALVMAKAMTPTYMMIFDGAWVLPLALHLIFGKKLTPEALERVISALRGAVAAQAPPKADDK